MLKDNNRAAEAVITKYGQVCEDHGWGLTSYEDEIELRTFTPAGEDFLFSVEADNFVDQIVEYATTDFDPDEHVMLLLEAKRNGFRGVPSVSRLVYDAEAIVKMLQELAIAVQEKADAEESE